MKRKILLGEACIVFALVFTMVFSVPVVSLAGTVPEADVSAAAEVDLDAPVAVGVELEGADPKSDEIIEELDENDGAVLFSADDGGWSYPAESRKQVVLDYTKIIRHENWFTRSFSVQYDGKSKVAYCIEPEEFPPEKGTQTAVKYDKEVMKKALYYSYGYPGYEKTMKSYLSTCDLDADYAGDEGAYVISHLLLSYLYDNESGSSDAFNGVSEGTRANIIKLADVMKNQWPEVPADSTLHFETDYEKVEWNKDKQYQETPVFRLKGHPDNRIAVKIPEGSVMIKVSGNQIAEYSFDENAPLKTIDVYGGDEFFFTAPADAEGRYESGEMIGSLQEFQLYMISVADKQDILYCGDGAKDSVSFSFEWIKVGQFTLDKVSASPEITENNPEYSLENAGYEIYDENGEKYAELSTDAEGGAEVMLPYGNYTLKEVKSPKGYVVDETAHDVVVDEDLVTFEHKENIVPIVQQTDASPRTGDDNLPVFCFAAALLSMTVIVICLCKRAG